MLLVILLKNFLLIFLPNISLYIEVLLQYALAQLKNFTKSSLY